MWLKIMVLGVGGFIGSNLRYWISLGIMNYLDGNFPLGTLMVNILGSFVLGFLSIFSFEVVNLNSEVRLLLGTGLLGAFTTFSTFSVETYYLIEDSNYMLAFLNISLNVVIGLAAVWFGFTVARSLV